MCSVVEREGDLRLLDAGEVDYFRYGRTSGWRRKGRSATQASTSSAGVPPAGNDAPVVTAAPEAASESKYEMVRRSRYCGPPDCGPLPMLRGWIRGGGPPPWEQLKGARTCLTWRGRGAIALILKSWGVGATDTVLVPAFNCGTEVDAVLAIGASVEMYRIDSQARIDLDDLTRRIRPGVSVVYVI